MVRIVDVKGNWPSLLTLVFVVGSSCTRNDRAEPAAQSRTSALSGSTSLQLNTLTNSCGANQAQDFFQVINNGSLGVKVSDITIGSGSTTTVDRTSFRTFRRAVVSPTRAAVFIRSRALPLLRLRWGPPVVRTLAYRELGDHDLQHRRDSPEPGRELGQHSVRLQSGELRQLYAGDWGAGSAPVWREAPTPRTFTSPSMTRGRWWPPRVARRPLVAPGGQQQLSGRVSPQMAVAPFVAPVPASTPVTVSIQIPAPNLQALTAAATAVSAPRARSTSTTCRKTRYRDLWSHPIGLQQRRRFRSVTGAHRHPDVRKPPRAHRERHGRRDRQGILRHAEQLSAPRWTQSSAPIASPRSTWPHRCFTSPAWTILPSRVRSAAMECRGPSWGTTIAPPTLPVRTRAVAVKRSGSTPRMATTTATSSPTNRRPPTRLSPSSSVRRQRLEEPDGTNEEVVSDIEMAIAMAPDIAQSSSSAAPASTPSPKTS